MSAPAAIEAGGLSLVPAFPDTTRARADVDEVSISLYDGHVPEFASRELDRLYGSIYSTTDRFSMDGTLDSANAYIVRRNGEITVLLLFRVDGKKIMVLNQKISLPAREIERFCSTVFTKYRLADFISLKAVQADLRDFHYLAQRHHCAEDIVTQLPGSAPELLASLGKSTRENIKRHINKINRAFPSFRFEVYVNQGIEDDKAAEIHRLHKARMRETQRALKLSDKEFADIISLAKRRGMMTVATIDGRVRGGLICWRVGDRYIMRIIAHDPALNDFKLGLVCCYLTMRECVEREAKFFHFMAGRLSYKYRLLGVEQYFDQIIVYRSLAAFLRNARLAWQMTMRLALQDTKLWAMNAEKRKDPLSIAVTGMITGWRRIKVFLRRLMTPLFRPRGKDNAACSDNA